MAVFIAEIITILVLLFLVGIFSVQFYYIVFRGHAPFISTKKRIIKTAVEKMNAGKQPIIYELGCGKAGFLREAGIKFPDAKLIGIEYSLAPYIIGKIQSSFSGNKIEIRKADMFKTDLKDADFVYCFLNVNAMKELVEKFKRELKPGAIVISYIFSLPGIEALETVKLSENDKIHFYRF